MTAAAGSGSVAEPLGRRGYGQAHISVKLSFHFAST